MRLIETPVSAETIGRRQWEGRLIDACADVRRAIGQDLHDGVCQDLIGIALGLSNAARELNDSHSPPALKVEAFAQDVRDVANRIRELAHGLSPVHLSKGGLPSALDVLARRTSKMSGVDCRFRWDGKCDVVDSNVANHVYYIAQEAIGNAMKHGKATRIVMTFGPNAGRACLRIGDNGVGIAQSVIDRMHLDDAIPMTGLGLHTMRYRADVVGGRLNIKRRRGGGTLVSCFLRDIEQRVDRLSAQVCPATHWAAV